MAIVLDYTQRIAPGLLKAADVYGVCRYLSKDTASWKVISKSEYNELWQAGIHVFLNWEYSATDWMTSQGSKHGEEAARKARALGYPQGSVLIGSCDFDMTRPQWTGKGRAYAKAFAAAVHSGGYRPGVYGPWDVLQWVGEEHIMDVFWQAGMSTAWSQHRNANAHPLADIRQRGHKKIGSLDTDWNEIRHSPLWTATTLATKRGSTNMLIVGINGQAAQYLTVGNGEKTHIGPALSEALTQGGVPIVWADDEDDMNFIVNVGKTDAVPSTVDPAQVVDQFVTKLMDALKAGLGVGA